MPKEKIVLSEKSRKRGLLIILCFGISLFIYQLGSTGVFDETPALFAAAGRGMHLTGDWLTPRVNGLPRFDKPPLIYWLMGLGYSLPGKEIWDPLGSWSARLPSALSSICMMLVIGETLMLFPKKNDLFPRRTAVIASLAFALSPLTLIWSRIGVSDALLCSTLGISLLFQWRRYINPLTQSWWIAWVILALAVLTKGPVAVVLTLMTLFMFACLQRDFKSLIFRIRPLRGLLITSLISLPWYLIELFLEGRPFFNSFFGYHNFQRLTSVVNSHQQPWWFFGFILIISSLPFTPFLFDALWKEVNSLFTRNFKIKSQDPSESLSKFAFSWLFCVLLLFTFAATKLPSYWLPATPAAGILIALSNANKTRKKIRIIFWFLSVFILCFFSLFLWNSDFLISSINDPEMPNLASEILDIQLHKRAALTLITSVFVAIIFASKLKLDRESIVFIQFPIVVFQLFIMTGIWNLADRLRQLPLRQAADLIISTKSKNEPLAMVGIKKPSIHFYTNEIIFFESNDVVALVNLAERLKIEKRNMFQSRDITNDLRPETFLMVIDQATSEYEHWQKLNPEILGNFGIYKVWRVNRNNLDKRAFELQLIDIKPDWQELRPERF
tara:strand:- start:624 stop:2462 length:1839 start_codon:yes stop_codon:yes gene_type:complete